MAASDAESSFSHLSQNWALSYTTSWFRQQSEDNETLEPPVQSWSRPPAALLQLNRTCGGRQLGWSVGWRVGPWWDVDVVEVGGWGTRLPWSWAWSEADPWCGTQTLVLVCVGLRRRPASEGTPVRETWAWETFSPLHTYQRDRERNILKDLH